MALKKIRHWSLSSLTVEGGFSIAALAHVDSLDASKSFPLISLIGGIVNDIEHCMLL
ncbi:hypothetical protein FS842_000836, partial [Serendipita sp. 407]